MDKARAIIAQMKLERKYVNLPGLNGTQLRNIGFCSEHEKTCGGCVSANRGGGITDSVGLVESGNCARMLRVKLSLVSGTQQPADQWVKGATLILKFKVKENQA